jgi:hypothetical protein
MLLNLVGSWKGWGYMARGILFGNNFRHLAGGAMAVIFVGAVAVAQQVPVALQTPANERIVLQVHAKGDQIYSCKVDGTQAGWTLKAPEAQLFDKDGKAFGRHFAGPSWEASDGSRVMAQVISIQRINTKGGKAPASGCDARHAGQEVRVPYSADYRFFAAK